MERIKIRTYVSGEYTISREQTGYMHGMEWAVRKGSDIVTTASTLKAAKRAAAVEAGKPLSFELGR